MVFFVSPDLTVEPLNREPEQSPKLTKESLLWLKLN